jgi:hypothetical protein
MTARQSAQRWANINMVPMSDAETMHNRITRNPTTLIQTTNGSARCLVESEDSADAGGNGRVALVDQMHS